MGTKIEYLTKTWNPVTGCSPISDGCLKCWAKRMAQRQKGRNGYDADNPFKVTLRPERLAQPRKWRNRQRVGVCLMGDLFHENVPDGFVDDVFCAMRGGLAHSYYLLTKRPQRLYEYFNAQNMGSEYWKMFFTYTPGFSNLFLGTSIEDQVTADMRLKHLMRLKTISPHFRLWASVEPMLGPVDLSKWLDKWFCQACGWVGHKTKGKDRHCPVCDASGPYEIESDISQVIVGCESGPGARQIDIKHIRSIRDQCKDAGVPFFLKQMHVDGKLVKMPELDGVIHDELPGVRG